MDKGTRRRALRILIVEDDPINQKTTARIVESLGHTFELAENGREAIAALERQRFDVVLMDLHMPVMDGITATAKIRKRWPREGRATIIALTASNLPGDVELAMAAGMDHHLAKPPDRKRLAELLEAIPDSSQDDRADRIPPD